MATTPKLSKVRCFAPVARQVAYDARAAFLDAVRVVPQDQDEIRRCAPLRSPISFMAHGLLHSLVATVEALPTNK